MSLVERRNDQPSRQDTYEESFHPTRTTEIKLYTLTNSIGTTVKYGAPPIHKRNRRYQKFIHELFLR
jgi:hypothetical protein